MEKCLIVAVSEDNAIGINGNLPWHISEDLKFFKRTTSGFPVIMGRKTYESLPFKPLKGRTNIVLSRSSVGIDGVVVVSSLEDAYKAAEYADRCFVIGGASIYKEALDEMDHLFITRVHTIIEGADAFFPELDADIWTETEKSETFTDEATGLRYEFIEYKKK